VSTGPDGEVTVTIAGEFDAAASPSLQLLLEGLRVLGPAAITVDRRMVTSIDAAGIHALVSAEGGRP